MRRLDRTTRLIAALLALALMLPTAALAASPCCCVEQTQTTESGADETPPCCAASTDKGTPDEPTDEPGEDPSPCSDCNCPGPCCMVAKTPIDSTETDPALRLADATDHARPTADRFDDDGAAFELIHPPRA